MVRNNAIGFFLVFIYAVVRFFFNTLLGHCSTAYLRADYREKKALRKSPAEFVCLYLDDIAFLISQFLRENCSDNSFIYDHEECSWKVNFAQD